MQFNHISPYFSIVIPCWGAEEYFDEATSSVLKQSFCDLELILVDDKSPGNIPTMCDELAQKDVRVKVIHNSENLNISATQNVGLLAAEGEYILFLDNDDYLEPDILQAAHDHIESADRDERSDIVQCDYNMILEEGASKYSRFKLQDKYDIAHQPDDLRMATIIKLRMRSELTPCCASRFIRRDMLIQNRIFFNSRYDANQDVDFTTQAYWYAKRISVLKKSAYVQRKRPDSVSQNLSFQSRLNRFNLFADEIKVVTMLKIPIKDKLRIMLYLGRRFDNVLSDAKRDNNLTEQEMRLLRRAARKYPLARTLGIFGSIRKSIRKLLRR